VQPVLDKHCISCHNPEDAPKGLDLTGDYTDYFSVSYDCLARENQGDRNYHNVRAVSDQLRGSPYVSWIPTYNGQEQNVLDNKPLSWGSPQSKLADVVISGHPDDDGKARIQLNSAERRRILAWIDLNVPYYGSTETAYPRNKGCRRIYPEMLDKLLKDVAQRRCSQCHDNGKLPLREWTRIGNPQYNNFLRAPLAKAAGGSGKCGVAVFADTNDPDYQSILSSFEPIKEMLATTPRLDMPGGRPSTDVPRVCK
jgi:hypothetical protein